MISQPWLTYWLGVVRQQVITWTNVDPNLCHRMVSPSNNGSMDMMGYTMCQKCYICTLEMCMGFPCLTCVWSLCRFCHFSPYANCITQQSITDLGPMNPTGFHSLFCQIWLSFLRSIWVKHLKIYKDGSMQTFHVNCLCFVLYHVPFVPWYL